MIKSIINILLNLIANSTEMIITWHTISDADYEPTVEYGLNKEKLDYSASVEMSYFNVIDLYTYRTKLINLVPTTTYCK